MLSAAELEWPLDSSRDGTADFNFPFSTTVFFLSGVEGERATADLIRKEMHMRLLPVDTRDAKEMARRLCDQLEAPQLVSDCRNPTADFLTLQQTQEVLARSMGYEGGWRELSTILKTAHLRRGRIRAPSLHAQLIGQHTVLEPAS
jgi:hypothetical protein